MEEPVVGQFISSLFLIPQKSGKLRPVINLHSLNTFVNYRHFKMEGIKFVKDLLMPGDFGGLIDLKDAYFMIPIYEGHRKYLRFVWQGQLFQFTCLPFGLSSAPRTFTKILKPVAAQLQAKGIRCVFYLDDILNGRMFQKSPVHSNYSSESGIHHQSGEITISTHTTDHISGFSHKLCSNDVVSSSGKSQPDNRALSNSFKGKDFDNS